MDMQRFFTKVNKIPNGCWEWTGGYHKFGYGRFANNVAHRVSYAYHNGPIPKGLCVCHKCDNPKCVNPEHLFLGTRKDNNLDRTSKGRTFKGSQVTISRFTEQQVLDIRSSSKSISELSKQYGVGYNTIWTIIKRKTWDWL